jgi:hypothetical protein
MREAFRHQVHGPTPTQSTGAGSTPSSASSFDTGFNDLLKQIEEQKLEEERWREQLAHEAVIALRDSDAA